MSAASDPSFSQELLSVTAQPTVNVPANTQAIKDVQSAGVTVDSAIRSKINFVSGCTVTDDALNDRVNVTFLSPVVAHGSRTSSVTTTGTSYGTGADLLASAVTFTADGSSDYAVRFSCAAFSNPSNPPSAALTLDGSQSSTMIDQLGSTQMAGDVSCLISAPSAGTHSVNIRVWAGGATTLTVKGGAGGSSTDMPILVTVMRLS